MRGKVKVSERVRVNEGGREGRGKTEVTVSVHVGNTESVLRYSLCILQSLT